MIHWFRTIDYCFRFSFCLLTYVNFLHFFDNDDRMLSKRRDLSALVFLINQNWVFSCILLTIKRVMPCRAVLVTQYTPDLVSLIILRSRLGFTNCHKELTRWPSQKFISSLVFAARLIWKFTNSPFFPSSLVKIRQPSFDLNSVKARQGSSPFVVFGLK